MTFSEYWYKQFPNGLPPAIERQHYVPVKYLEAWRTGRKIAMKSKSTEPKMVGLRDVMVESWFYEFPRLNLAELETIIDVMDIKSEYERKSFALFIGLSVVQDIAGRLAFNKMDGEGELMLNVLRSKGLYDEVCERSFMIKQTALHRNQELYSRGYEILRRNGAEKLMSAIEHNAWPLLDKAVRGEGHFLKEPSEFIGIVEYLFLQMYRTPRLDYVFSQTAKGKDVPVDFAKNMIPYLRIIFAIKATHRVLTSIINYEFLLVRNKSGVNFITGDYPFAHLTDYKLDSDFVFPVSPKYAIYLGEKGCLKREYGYLLNPTAKTVCDINEKIAMSAVRQVLANNVSELADVKVGV